MYVWERDSVCERERESIYVCVCGRERQCVRERGRERESIYMFVCGRDRYLERERERVCVWGIESTCVCVEEREL